MRKWILLGVLLLAVVSVAALALLNLNSLINRNRDYLLLQAEQALGRRVSVGEMELTFWPGIGLRLKNVALSDDPSFRSGDFIRAGDLQVNVKLLPLLRKQLHIKRLILHDPVIEIVRNEEGRFNFSGIGKRAKQKKEKRKKAGTDKSRDPDDEDAAFLSIALVDIARGKVHYLDRKEKIEVQAGAIDFRVKELDLGKPFSVELAAALFSEKQNFKLEGKIGPIPAEGDFSKAPLEVKVHLDPLDFSRLSAAVPKIKSALPRDLHLSGPLRIKDLQIKGSIKSLALKGAVEGTEAAINFGKSLQKASGIPLVFSTDAQVAGQTLSFRQAKLALHNLELAGRGDVTWGDSPVVNLSLDSKRASLEGWDKIIPAMSSYQLSGNFEVHTLLRGPVGKGSTPQIRGEMILSGMSAQPPRFPQAIKDLNARIRFAGKRADIPETTLKLGNSKIRLTAQIESFSPLALSYRISTPELRPADFQESLPEDRKADVIKNFSSEGSLGIKEGRLTLQGKAGSSQGTLYKIGYKNLVATFSREKERTNIRNLRVHALNGSLQAEGEYSSNGPVPSFSLASKVEGLDLNELYRTLDSKRPRDIRGSLNADLEVSGSGKDWKEIRPNLRGRGKAEVLEGALLNFNLAEGVMSGLTGIPGLASRINPKVRQKYPETFEAKDTVFKELKGVFDLGEGRMKVKELRIAAAEYTVQGNGWADFERRVDFRSVLVFSQRLSDDLGRAAREVKFLFNEQNQLELPFVLSGTLPNVKPRLDSKYLVQMMQRGWAGKGAEEFRRRFFGDKQAAPPEGPPVPGQKRRNGESTEERIRRGMEGLFRR